MKVYFIAPIIVLQVIAGNLLPLIFFKNFLYVVHFFYECVKNLLVYSALELVVGPGFSGRVRAEDWLIFGLDISIFFVHLHFKRNFLKYWNMQELVEIHLWLSTLAKLLSEKSLSRRKSKLSYLRNEKSHRELKFSKLVFWSVKFYWEKNEQKILP